MQLYTIWKLAICQKGELNNFMHKAYIMSELKNPRCLKFQIATDQTPRHIKTKTHKQLNIHVNGNIVISLYWGMGVWQILFWILRAEFFSSPRQTQVVPLEIEPSIISWCLCTLGIRGILVLHSKIESLGDPCSLWGF